MTRKEELIQELLKDCETPEEIIGENGLLKQLTKMLLEGALKGELNHHLGYKKNEYWHSDKHGAYGEHSF